MSDNDNLATFFGSPKNRNERCIDKLAVEVVFRLIDDKGAIIRLIVSVRATRIAVVQGRAWRNREPSVAFRLFRRKSVGYLQAWQIMQRDAFKGALDCWLRKALNDGLSFITFENLNPLGSLECENRRGILSF